MEDVNNSGYGFKVKKILNIKYSMSIRNIIDKNKIVLAVVLPILVLVIIRSFSTNHFKTDANKCAEPAFLHSNIITAGQEGTLPGKKLTINLGKNINKTGFITRDVLNISADSILIKRNLKIIRDHNGPVLLFSPEPAVAARIWMVLSQLGYKDIYILALSSDNEVLKYKFQPDTLVRPEL
jgi:hypothetical protein